MRKFDHPGDLGQNWRMSIKDIDAEALALSREDRASRAHRLLLSLEKVSDSEFEQVFVEESVKRSADADAESGSSISGAEVVRKARALRR